MAEIQLTEMEKDTLAEIGNISMGSAATALSNLLNRRVQITTPKVTITNMAEIKAKFPIPCIVVMIHFTKGLKGDNILIIKNEDALLIVGLMMGMEPPHKPEQMGELELSAIEEAMNQMVGSSATAMSDFFNFMIDITPPELEKIDLRDEEAKIKRIEQEEHLVEIAFRMEVEDILDSQILQVIPLDHAKEMVRHLLSNFEEAPEEEKAPPAEEQPGQKAQGKEALLDEAFLEEAAGLLEEEERKPAIFGSQADEESGLAPQAAGGNGEAKSTLDYSKLSLIRDIPIELQVVLGEASVSLKDLAGFGPGVVVPLNRYAGEPVELYANNKLVARGEVVLVNGYFGLKISSIEKTTERQQ